ncbi:MAG TPA: hypothetical protein VF378_14470, partial [Geothrix sp.]
MPLLLLVLPALVAAQTPPTPLPIEHVQDLMRAIPVALIDGKRGAMRGLVLKARAGWEQAKPELRKTLPEPEVAFIDKQLKAMEKMKPAEQGIGALGLSSTLSRFQARSRKQDLLQLGRLVMAAWCGVDAGQWEPFPNVEQGFKTLLEQDGGQHTLAGVSVQEALKRLQAGRKKHQAADTKKALKELLSLVDLFE